MINGDFLWKNQAQPIHHVRSTFSFANFFSAPAAFPNRAGMVWIFLAGMIASALLLSVAYTPVQVLGVAGGSVFLQATPPPNFHVRETIWCSLTPSEELVATSYKGTPEIQYQSRFYGRTQLHNNFTLEIHPVDLEDAGIFSVLLVDTTGKMKREAFGLEVYDEVSTPVIQVFTEARDTNSSSEACILFLTCNAASRTNVTYDWAGLGGRRGQSPKHWVMEEGQVLRVKLDRREDLQMGYTCTASNAVSQKSAGIELRDSCQRRSEGGKETAYRFRDILLIVIPVASFFFLLTGLLCVCYKQHSGKKMSYAVPGNELIPL